MSREGARPVRVAVLGAGYIGQVHSLAIELACRARRERVEVERSLLIDADAGLAAEVAARYGWREIGADWASLADADVDLFVNAAPNDLHVEPTRLAARDGTTVFCEKPLARSADEALALLRAVEQSGAAHRCAFVHRFVPALQVARELIRAGELGEVRHVRSRFLMDMREDGSARSWRFDRDRAGPGALGDLGSHHIDIARFLVGEVLAVAAVTRTWTQAPGVEVNDDAFACVAELEGGATATFEASRVAAAHALTGVVEVEGTAGSLAFTMERMNELVLRTPGGGPRVRMTTRAGDPCADFALPTGLQGSHPIGWQECFAFQMAEVLAVAAGRAGDDSSACATFRDGYRVAEIVDAIGRAAGSRRWEEVCFRDAGR